MTDKEKKLDEIEKAVKDDAARQEDLEGELEQAERKTREPTFRPDHARDGGVF